MNWLFDLVDNAPVQFWSAIIALFGGLNFLMAVKTWRRNTPKKNPFRHSAASPPRRSKRS